MEPREDTEATAAGTPGEFRPGLPRPSHPRQPGLMEPREDTEATATGTPGEFRPGLPRPLHPRQPGLMEPREDTEATAAGTPGEGARLRAMVGLLLANLAVMPAAIFTLFFAPLAVAPLAAAALYATLWACERRCGVASPITRIMTAFYLLFALARYRFEDGSWMAWSAPVVYWTLAVLILALLLAGRPFTVFYAGDAGFMPLQRRVALMWGSLHLAAGGAALALAPGLGFLFVPMALMVFGTVATLWLSFVSMGRAYERQPRFELGRYSFREATSPEDREAFYSVIATAYRADLQKAFGVRRRIDAEAIGRGHRASDARREGSFLPFLVFAGGRPVGGICIFFDHRTLGLPVEGEARIDLAPWRRAGPVAEVGRLGLLERYRLNPVLLKGLFKCVVEAAAERNVHFIFNDSFTFQAGIYRKIGFAALCGEPYVSPDEHSTGYGLAALPMVMSLAGMVRMDVRNSMADDMRDILAPYVIERFFKRLAVRDLVDRLLFPKRNLKEIRNANA